MKEGDLDVIKNATDDLFSLKDELFRQTEERHFQLMLARVDLFKDVASIILAFLGVGFVFDKIAVNIFSVIAVILSLSLLIFIFSYSREILDLRGNELNDVLLNFSNKIDRSIAVAMKAINARDAQIFYDHAEEERQKKMKDENAEEFIGEIVLLIFLLIVLFLIAAFLNEKFDFTVIQQLLIVAVIFASSWMLSFKNWSYRLGLFFSKKCSNPVKYGKKN